MAVASVPAPAVVAAVNMRKLSNLVATRALDLAAASGGTVHFVCVSEPNIAGVVSDDLDAPELLGTSLAGVDAFAQKRLKDFKKRRPDVPAPKVKAHVDTGDPAEKIVALAADVDADVILIATHGRKGLKRFLLGSVAEKVVRLAGCSVQVVREKNHPERKKKK